MLKLPRAILLEIPSGSLDTRPAIGTEQIISVLKKFFDSWGPRLDHITRYAILTLMLDKQSHPLHDLRELLTNQSFRADVVARIEDPNLANFWQHEFPNMPKNAAASLLNKLPAFLTEPATS